MNEISRSQGGPGLQAIVVLRELPEAQRFSDAEPLPTFMPLSVHWRQDVENSILPRKGLI